MDRYDVLVAVCVGSTVMLLYIAARLALIVAQGPQL